MNHRYTYGVAFPSFFFCFAFRVAFFEAVTSTADAVETRDNNKAIAKR